MLGLTWLSGCTRYSLWILFVKIDIICILGKTTNLTQYRMVDHKDPPFTHGDKSLSKNIFFLCLKFLNLNFESAKTLKISCFVGHFCQTCDLSDGAILYGYYLSK
jgi:hypothetical protein